MSRLHWAWGLKVGYCLWKVSFDQYVLNCSWYDVRPSHSWLLVGPGLLVKIRNAKSGVVKIDVVTSILSEIQKWSIRNSMPDQASHWPCSYLASWRMSRDPLNKQNKKRSWNPDGYRLPQTVRCVRRLRWSRYSYFSAACMHFVGSFFSCRNKRPVHALRQCAFVTVISCLRFISKVYVRHSALDKSNGIAYRRNGFIVRRQA